MKTFKTDGGKYLMILFSMLLGIGAFLPWGTAFGETISNGLKGDGVITLGVAILVIILAGIPKVPLYISFILGIIATAVSMLVIYNLGQQNLTAESFGVEIGSGVGLYLSVLSGLGIALSSVYQKKLDNHDRTFTPIGLAIVGVLMVLIAAVYPSSKVPTIEVFVIGAIFLAVGGLLEAQHRKKTRIS